MVFFFSHGQKSIPKGTPLGTVPKIYPKNGYITSFLGQNIQTSTNVAYACTNQTPTNDPYTCSNQTITSQTSINQTCTNVACSCIN